MPTHTDSTRPVRIIWDCTFCGHHHERLEHVDLSIRYVARLVCEVCGWQAQAGTLS